MKKKKTKKIETSLIKREDAQTNPYGTNQWLKDPRQVLFLSYWKDPKSETFSDVKNSAIRAGYSPEYADNMTSLLPSWLLVAMGQLNNLLIKAERNLDQFLELPNETQAIGMYGPIFKKEKVQNGFYKNGKPKFKNIKVPQMQLDPKVMKVKQDTTHFIAETIGKARYNKRAGDGSTPLKIYIFTDEQRRKIAERIIRGGSSGNFASQGESN